VRVVTTLVAVASQHTCVAGLPMMFARNGAGAGFALQAVVGGDTPVAFGYKVLLGVSATGKLKAWDMRTGLTLGRALTMPATAAPVIVSSHGGPVVASKHVVVPEHGVLQAFAP